MIRVLVLDEADELIAQQGLGEQTFRIKQYVLLIYCSMPYADARTRLLPPNVQNVLFSATFNDDVQEFADRFAPEANKIFLRKEDITVEAIRQLYLECDSEDQKYEALSALYDCLVIGQSIVFCKVSPCLYLV